MKLLTTIAITLVSLMFLGTAFAETPQNLKNQQKEIQEYLSILHKKGELTAEQYKALVIITARTVSCLVYRDGAWLYECEPKKVEWDYGE